LNWRLCVWAGFLLNLKNMADWFIHGIKILLILTAAFIAVRFLSALAERIIKKGIKGKVKKEDEQRIETLMGVIGGTFKFLISIIALLMILPEFGVNAAPFLAGAGLIGLAVGMASKEIVSDFLAGLFIILEDQYRIGDKVEVGGKEGSVTEISLRRTVIKDNTGAIHLIPNSQIKIVTKKS